MKLGIGTAQFGFDYGISNRQGKTPLPEVKTILEIAAKSGIDFIDTASAYGESEEALGSALPKKHSFRIITKTQPVSFGQSAEKLKSDFYRSLEKMKQEKIYSLLFHHANEFFQPGGASLWEAMEGLKGEGLVEKIGASAYNPEEILSANEQLGFDIVQIPFSVFDCRMRDTGAISDLAASGVEIHARSIFLQGLLFIEPAELNAYFNPVREKLTSFREYCASFGMSPMDGAFAFIKGVREIECAIIGINDSAQLQINQESFGKDFSDEFVMGLGKFAINDPAFVNPSMWRLE